MPARATRHGELWQHLTRSTQAGPARTAPPRPWFDHPAVGPCARCRGWCWRYGPGGRPVCWPACTPPAPGSDLPPAATGPPGGAS